MKEVQIPDESAYDRCLTLEQLLSIKVPGVPMMAKAFWLIDSETTSVDERQAIFRDLRNGLAAFLSNTEFNKRERSALASVFEKAVSNHGKRSGNQDD